MNFNVCSNAFLYKNLCNENKINQKKYNSYPNLKTLQQDTVSFGSMKKNQFDSIDLVAVNRFKAPIEKFNNNEDLQNWCLEKINSDYINNDYEARRQNITEKRDERLNLWIEYCLNSDKFSNSASLLIIDGITSQLRSDNDILPPVLHKDILDDTMLEIEEKSKINKNYRVDFNKLYRNKLSSELLDIEELGENKTGWIIISSHKNDSANFETNVNKLEMLSHHSWCTKSSKAELYLFVGDFHIYVENGKPQAGIMFKDDEIQEIQGKSNNGKIPIKYLDIIKEHVQNSKMNDKTKNELKEAEQARTKIDDFKNKLGKSIESATAEELFETAGMLDKCDKKDGSIILKSYSQPSEYFTWEDIGVNENNLFKVVKEIKGNANFNGSEIKTLGKLQKIGGYAVIRGSKITDTGDLETIGDSVDFENSILTNLGKLRKIGGYANFAFSKISTLGVLEEIGGDAYFEGSDVTDLGKLLKIGGEANFRKSKVKNLGELEYVGRKVVIDNSYITPQMVLEKGFRFF